MSKYRQRKALDVLKQCGLVDIHYFTSIRCNHYFKSLTYNYQNVVELPNAVRKHIEYLKSPYKFISALAREEPQPEIDEDDYEYDEYDDLEFAEFQSKYKELIAAEQEHP